MLETLKPSETLIMLAWDDFNVKYKNGNLDRQL